jgi:hypothetical protein
MTPTEYREKMALPRAVIVDLARELLTKRKRGEDLERTFAVLEVAFAKHDEAHDRA